MQGQQYLPQQTKNAKRLNLLSIEALVLQIIQYLDNWMWQYGELYHHESYSKLFAESFLAYLVAILMTF